MELLATTGDAFVRVGAPPRLQGSGAQCLAYDGETVYVGCRGGGLKRSADGGDTFEEVPLPERDVFSVAVSAADGAVYAGTEPSRVFCSRDGGESWEELVALQDIPSRSQWSFPPRPWTSHVRWIAPSPHEPEVVLVGIELGGLMRTEDGGASFSDHRSQAARDVHCLAWHLSAPDRATRPLSEREQPVRLGVHGRDRDLEPLACRQQQQRIADRLSRRDHHHTPRVLREHLNPTNEALLDSPCEPLRLDQAEAARQLPCRQPPRKLQQRQRIPARLRDDPVSDPLIQSEPDGRAQQRPCVAVAHA